MIVKEGLTCVRGHERVEPGHNGSCEECHRERAVLEGRLRRSIEVLVRHETTCPLLVAICPQRRPIAERALECRRALDEWRGVKSEEGAAQARS